MALAHELEEDIRKQEGRVNYAKWILASREDALARVSAIEGSHYEVMWKWGAHSGAKLFECHAWLEREVKEAKGWVQEQERRLFLLKRQLAAKA